MYDERVEKRAKEKMAMVFAGLLAIVAIAAGIIAYYYHQNKQIENALENQYNRAFEEVVDYVRDIDVSLTKGKLVTSPSQMAKLSSEIFMQSSEASSNLGQLPIAHQQLNNTAKFLSQVADYTYMLSQKAINSEKMTDDEYKTLLDLTSYADKLYENLQDMQNDLYSGNLNFSRLKSESKDYMNASQQADVSPLGNIEKEFQDYPTLIYDGPFSDHLEKMEAVYLKNKPAVSQNEAKQKLTEFLKGYDIESITSTGESQGTIPTFGFDVKLKGKDDILSADVSKAGGYVVWMLHNTNVKKATMTFDDASKKASDFLASRGFSHMKQSYYETKDNIATINFAYMQGNTIIYPDLIKLKISLENGEIIGFESKGYLMSHQDTRTLAAPKVTMDQARAKLNTRLTIQKQAMALVPTDSKQEVLCYEFTGTVDKQHFIVYINAQTGEEQQILLLLESKTGILTM